MTDPVRTALRKAGSNQGAHRMAKEDVPEIWILKCEVPDDVFQVVVVDVERVYIAPAPVALSVASQIVLQNIVQTGETFGEMGGSTEMLADAVDADQPAVGLLVERFAVQFAPVASMDAFFRSIRRAHGNRPFTFPTVGKSSGYLRVGFGMRPHWSLCR